MTEHDPMVEGTEAEDFGFDFQIVDEDEFDPFAPDPDDPEAVAADEIDELPVMKELPESVRKPSVYDKSRFASPQEAIKELFHRNPSRQPVFLAIIDYCCEPHTSSEVEAVVDEFQKSCFSVYSAMSLCQMLEKSGALVAEVPQNADEAVDEDGAEYLEIKEPQEAVWTSTDDGLIVLSDCRCGSELEAMLSGGREERYRDVYLELMDFLAEKPRTMGAINDKYAGDSRLEDPHKAPSHFIDCLQEVAAVEWKGCGWALTELAQNYRKNIQG